MSGSFPDHYAALGVPPEASAAEVKSAYRRLVLEHHPDRSPGARSKEIFLKATEAWDVLGDEDRRRDYDAYREFLRTQDEQTRARRIQEGVAKVRAAQEAERVAKAKTAAITLEERNRLAMLLGRGRLGDAEALAVSLLKRDPRFGLGYAVLGDLARLKGDIRAASKHYAYAVQFEPGNTTFQQRYEDTLHQIPVRTKLVQDPRPGQETTVALGPAVAGGVVSLGAASIPMGLQDRALGIPFAPSWTLSLLLGIFVAGVALGLFAALAGTLERFSGMVSTAGGGASPVLSLGVISLINFWLATAVYLVVGIWQNAFSKSLTRIMVGVGLVTLLFTFLGGATERFHMGEVFLWGGSLASLGAFCGWAVSDGFRRAAL